MPPYSQATGGPTQITPAAPLAPSSTAKKLRAFRRSESSSSSICEAETETPRENTKIDRWQQLRQMMQTLTGLPCGARGADTAPTSSVTHARRRCRSRSNSDGVSNPILLLHHDFWLEAIDEKHRYGFHLRAFHEVWKREMAEEPSDESARPWDDDRNRSFFYWLDHGRGSRIELPDCDRDALEDTRVQYCSLEERTQFEVEFTASILQFADSHITVQTDNLSKWIFVLSQDDKLYVARKNKGQFHHSSFLAGVPIVAAGKIYVTDGKIHAIEPHSGHFKPKLGSLMALCHVLQAHGVDTDAVHFIKPRKWRDPWPFGDQESDEDREEIVSDSEES